jgi:hypothetical protein
MCEDQLWRGTFVILALERRGQEGREFKVSLGNSELEASLSYTSHSVSKEKVNNKNPQGLGVCFS